MKVDSRSSGGPRGSAVGGVKLGILRERIILEISFGSWMKATMRISDLHLGHSRGLISRTRFMQAAQDEDALAGGSEGCSVFSDWQRFFLSPRERQE